MHRETLLRQLFEDIDASKRLMQPYFIAGMSDLGISPAQARLLLTVKDWQPISLKALAVRMCFTPGAVTQTVDSLAQLGYLIRARDERDRRVIYINLSPSGLELAAKVKRQHNSIMKKMMSDLDDAELQQLTTIYDKINQHLAGNANDATPRKGKEV